jgi:hypothetical protein
MTVPNQTNEWTYTGNGVQTAFPYTQRIFQAADLVVTTIVGGVVTTLTLNVDYTVTGVLSYTGGDVVLVSALANLGTINIARDPAEVQLSVLQDQQPYLAKVVENAVDLLTMMIQAVRTILSRTLTLPPGSSASTVLPPPIATDLLGWDLGGTFITNWPQATVAAVNNTVLPTVDRFLSGVDYTPGVTTALTLSANPQSILNTNVAFDGTVQQQATYSISGTTITFSSPIPVGVAAVQVQQYPKVFFPALADGSVTTPKLANGAVTDAKLRNGAACSVIGRAANSIGVEADIAAAEDTVLLRNGNVVKFDKVDTDQLAVTGVAAATYTNPTIQVGVDGRIIAAANGAGLGMIILEDQKANGTPAQGLTSLTWVKRELNTEVLDTNGDCALGANSFVLAAGTYDIAGRAPAYKGNRHKLVLYNATDNLLVLAGESAYVPSADGQTEAFLSGRFTIAAGKTLEIWHFAANGVAGGGGVETNVVGTGLPVAAAVAEVYTHIELVRRA